jgi:hypothetical protein
MKDNDMIKKSRLFILTLLAVGGLNLTVTTAALACGPCTNCMQWSNEANMSMVQHEQWWDNTFWKNYFLVGLQQFTDRAAEAMIMQAAMIGGFMDAQNHLNAQRTLQEMTATAMKNYMPSEAVCQMGTLSRSLASSQARSRVVQLVMSERSQARQLGKQNMAGAPGPDDDRLSRLSQFQKTFCDPQDNNNGLAKLCGDAGGPNDRHNLDIDFTRAIDTKPTLNINMTDSSVTPDEAGVFALGNNLYSHEIFKRSTSADLKGTGANDGRSAYMDFRSIVAKRSAAENSYNTLVGMKAAGTEASRIYIKQMLANLGMSETDIRRYINVPTKPSVPNPPKLFPSYSSQMEILTKKIYQDPSFYVHLMDKPANVQRQYAAMQSFGLMQQRDIFETIVRSEMLLSLIVEMEVAKYQDYVQNRINTTLKQ